MYLNFAQWLQIAQSLFFLLLERWFQNLILKFIIVGIYNFFSNAFSFVETTHNNFHFINQRNRYFYSILMHWRLFFLCYIDKHINLINNFKGYTIIPLIETSINKTKINRIKKIIHEKDHTFDLGIINLLITSKINNREVN